MPPEEEKPKRSPTLQFIAGFASGISAGLTMFVLALFFSSVLKSSHAFAAVWGASLLHCSDISLLALATVRIRVSRGPRDRVCPNHAARRGLLEFAGLKGLAIMQNVLPAAGRLRSLPFWKQATITSVSAGVLVFLWSACGGTYTPPPPPPLSSPRLELRGRHGDVLALAFSPAGEWLAAATSDKMVRLWDVSKSEVLRTMAGHTGEITSLAVGPDGKILASGSADKTIKLWEASTGKEIRTLTGHTARVTSIAFSPDGRSLASASEDETIRLWETSSGQQVQVFKGHRGRVNSVAFSPDDRLLASAGDDRTARLWDPRAGNLVRALDHLSRVTSVAFDPDGKLLATGTAAQLGFPVARKGEIRLWNIENGAVELPFSKFSRNVRCLAFRPDGKVLASASDFSGPSVNSEVALWDVHTRELLSRWDAERDHHLYTIAFSPDGRWLASGGHSGGIRLWQ